MILTWGIIEQSHTLDWTEWFELTREPDLWVSAATQKLLTLLKGAKLSAEK